MKNRFLGKLKFNLQWVIHKKIDTFEFFGMYGEEKLLEREKDPVIFSLLEEIYQYAPVDVNLLVEKIHRKNKGRISLRKVVVKLDELLSNQILALETKESGKFATEELERYKWQLEYFASYESLKNSKYDIQNNLKNSKVAIIGLGGQGSVICRILTAMGIGEITIVDGDTIEPSNLTRQIFYNHEDVGKHKVEIMKGGSTLQNPYVKVLAIPQHVISKANLRKVFRNQDFVVLCADKPLIKLREWVNHVALETKVPYIAVNGNWVGPICMPFQTACFECEKAFCRRKYKNYDTLLGLLKQSEEMPRPSFAFRPILSGTLIALEIIKFLSKVIKVDVLDRRFQLSTDLKCEFERIPRDKNCHACGDKVIR